VSEKRRGRDSNDQRAERGIKSNVGTSFGEDIGGGAAELLWVLDLTST